MTLTLKIEVWFQKIVYKHSADWEKIFVTSTPEAPQCFPFCSQIIHHTQRKKRSNFAAASHLMWTGTLG